MLSRHFSVKICIMNIRRGLIRLWVIFSALWVAGLLVINAPDLLRSSDELVYPALAFASPGYFHAITTILDKLALLPSAPVDHSQLAQGKGDAWQEGIKNYIAQVAAENTASRRIKLELIVAILVAAIGVPLALLALVIALRWGIAGFKKELKP
jgi:hypothetical protein